MTRDQTATQSGMTNHNRLAPDFQLRTVGVVGAGQMGRGIIHAVASRGVTVLFVERDVASVRRSLELLAADLEKEIGRWSLTEAEKRAILARVEGTASMNDLARVDVAIEAIDENLERKKAIFRQIDAVLPAGRPIVTNTSTLSITELAAVTSRPGLVSGVHFLYPAWRRPVVEVIRGLHTTDEAVGVVLRLLKMLQKTGVEVIEYPGYITTRAIVPYLNEAMYMVMEGVASAEDIDTAMKLGYDFPSGPLSLADRMGLDEVMAWMDQLFRDLGDVKYRPCPLLRKMVRAGRMGVKSRAGFFEYDEEGRRIGQATSAASLLPTGDRG